jgi:hypothetical protein
MHHEEGRTTGAVSRCSVQALEDNGQLSYPYCLELL